MVILGGTHRTPEASAEADQCEKACQLSPRAMGVSVSMAIKTGPRNPVEENPGPVDDEVVHHSAMASGLVAVGSHLWSARISTWRP